MILIIDDDLFGMKSYRLTLEEGGYDVAVAETPDEAMKILETDKENVELILLDVMLPTGNLLLDHDVEQGLRTGKVLFEILRDQFPQIPIIVLSITAAEDFGKEGIEFLWKADTLPSELLRTVQSKLDKSG